MNIVSIHGNNLERLLCKCFVSSHAMSAHSLGLVFFYCYTNFYMRMYPGDLHLVWYMYIFFVFIPRNDTGDEFREVIDIFVVLCFSMCFTSLHYTSLSVFLAVHITFHFCIVVLSGY